MENISIYAIDNKKKNSEKNKQYREEHRDIILEKQKANYKINREQHLEDKKKYYQDNKVKLKEKGKETYVCQCGKELTKKHKARHEKTIGHLNYINELKNN